MLLVIKKNHFVIKKIKLFCFFVVETIQLVISIILSV